MIFLRNRRPRDLTARVHGVLAATTLWLAPIGPGPHVPDAGTARGSVSVQAPGTAAAVVVPTATGSRSTRVQFADGARSWPRGVVTVATSVPRSYRWSVEHGVKAWNRTHSGVRFVWRPADKAALLIKLGRTGGASARATVGYRRTGRNVVTLKKTSVSGWQARQVYGRVVAHELGHVLGLEHTHGARCGLMEASLDASCSPEPSEGTYACRWISSAIGGAIVNRYGGSFSRGPRRCSL